MGQEPKQPEEQPEPDGSEEQPPPFDPDPKLVTYLERGRKTDAEERFRTETEGDKRGS